MKDLDRRAALVGSTAVVVSSAGSEAAQRTPPVRQFTDVTSKHYGKYRGSVVNNNDPMQTGRVRAAVPDLGLSPSGWALPCLPAAGPHTGVFSVPPIGAAVWIEFEGGDVSKPIWSGGYWQHQSDMPVPGASSSPQGQTIVLATTSANLTVSDMQTPTGGIVLKSQTGAMIAVNDTGIYISNGKGATVVLVGPTVTINNSHSFT